MFVACSWKNDSQRVIVSVVSKLASGCFVVGIVIFQHRSGVKIWEFEGAFVLCACFIIKMTFVMRLLTQSLFDSFVVSCVVRIVSVNVFRILTFFLLLYSLISVEL